MMKRLLSLALIALLVLSAFGCGKVDADTARKVAGVILEDVLSDGMPEGNGNGGELAENVRKKKATPTPSPLPAATPAAEASAEVVYGTAYSTKEEVALYLHTYGELPPNYLTKNEAKDRGWISSRGNLWQVTDHMSIGGDFFGNYEGLLPTAKGRKYYECDIDFNGGTRNAKRIIFSKERLADGSTGVNLIYYTEDHYNSFELLYGEESAW